MFKQPKIQETLAIEIGRDKNLQYKYVELELNIIFKSV